MQAAHRRALPLGGTGVGAAEPAEHAQLEILQHQAVGFGPLVVAGVAQERAAVERQGLLEGLAGRLELVRGGEPAPALTGDAEAVGIHVDRQLWIQAVVAIAEQDRLVAAVRPAAAQRAAQRVDGYLQVVRTRRWLGSRPERLNQGVARGSVSRA